MADKLVETEWAYPCFCTEEELIAKREQVRYFATFCSAPTAVHMLGGLTPVVCCTVPHGVASSRLGEHTVRPLAYVDGDFGDFR